MNRYQQQFLRQRKQQSTRQSRQVLDDPLLLPASTTTVVVEVEIEIEVVAAEDTTAPWLVIGLLLCLLVCCFFGACSSCYRVPGRDYQQGALIRRQAQRNRENERRRKARQEKYTDEERQQQIHNDSTIQTMRVIEKELPTGYYRLGPIINNTTTTTTTTTKISTHDDEVSSSVAHTKETNIGMNIMSIESKPSTDTADTVPFDSDSDSDSEFDHHNDCNEEEDDENDNDDHTDDYEGVCHICLDGFNIDDTVMFHNNRKLDRNRNTKDCTGGDSNSDSNNNEPQLGISSNCGHVFHQECIMQWLVERRENECPSCRSVFIDSTDDDDSSDNNIIHNDEGVVENNSDFVNNNNNTNNENDSDSDSDPGSDSITIEVDLEKGILHDNNNNDCNNSHHPNLSDTINRDEEITNNNDNKGNDNNGDNNNNDNPITYYIAHGRILAVRYDATRCR